MVSASPGSFGQAASSPGTLSSAKGKDRHDTPRLETLDVLRGFALLGILLLNIVGFGLPAAAYFNPELGAGLTATTRSINLSVWALVDVLFEGAMRALFSMLFGAGVVLFTTGAAAKPARVFFRRNAWLLVFGGLNAFLLLWSGDVLLTYALVGFLLYPARHASPRRLFVFAGLVLLLLTAFNALACFGLSEARQLAEAQPRPEMATGTEAQPAEAPSASGGQPLTEEQRALAASWEEFAGDYAPTAAERQAERSARQASYGSAWWFTAALMKDVLLFQLPAIMLWDALAMMLLGMALFKTGVLEGKRSVRFYAALAAVGFGVGLGVNLWELRVVIDSDFDLLATHGFMRWTYHLGRLGMALGYLGAVVLCCRLQLLARARRRLAAVGRMALTNYLMHSAVGLLLFTGAGFALVDTFERWQLYVLVMLVWAFQLWFSSWWLQRYHYGPLEWLWRGLSYEQWPRLRR